MKNYIKRIMALALVCCLLCTRIVHVNAEEYPENTTEILGSSSDVTGYLLPDENEVPNGARALPEFFPVDHGDEGRYFYKIFSIHAEAVSNLLPSSEGAKHFTVNSLPDTATLIMCRGTLSNTETLNIAISAGICSYNASRDVYESAWKMFVTPGQECGDSFFIEDELFDYTVYYSFVKNESRRGYVSGDWTVYYT